MGVSLLSLSYSLSYLTYLLTYLLTYYLLINSVQAFQNLTNKALQDHRNSVTEPLRSVTERYQPLPALQSVTSRSWESEWTYER